MYFLKNTIHGMRRRLFASILALFSTTAILLSATSLGFWSYWIQGGDQINLKANRMLAVFVDPTNTNSLSSISEKIRDLKEVSTIQIIGVREFKTYLSKKFPEIFQILDGVGEDIFPRVVEVTFPSLYSRKQQNNAINKIKTFPGVSRVESGNKRIGGAKKPLYWLSVGGVMLAIALWLVLVIMATNHYQNIQSQDAQEIYLIQSFGASPRWILLPWVTESVLYATVGSLGAAGILLYGRNFIILLFNQFFTALGYDPFMLDNTLLLWALVAMFLAGLVAHTLGAAIAFMRNSFA